MKENVTSVDSDIFIEKKHSKKKKKKSAVKKVENSFNDSDKIEENLEKFAEELKTTPIVNNATADVDKKREELVKAAEEGYIDKKVEYIKKCGVKVIDKIYKSYEIKRKKDADVFLTDLIISRFCSMLGGLDAIEDPEVLTDELKKNTVMKKDIENAVSVISPYIPMIGILGGIATTGKYIYKHKNKSATITEKEKS